MKSIAESLKILLDTKNELKHIMYACGVEPSNDLSSYASKLESMDIESIIKLMAVATKNYTTDEMLFIYYSEDYLDCNGWQNENVLSCKNMFKYAKSVSIGLKKFLTPKVTDMYGMFYGCDLLKTLDISSLTTTNVIDMAYMFYDCKVLESITGDIDCSNLTNSIKMFYGCNELVNLSLINIYANCDMSDNDTWSINLGHTKVSDECLVNIINQLPDLATKGIETNTQIKLELPVNNTLTLEQAQIALNKKWILTNTNY